MRLSSGISPEAGLARLTSALVEAPWPEDLRGTWSDLATALIAATTYG